MELNHLEALGHESSPHSIPFEDSTPVHDQRSGEGPLEADPHQRRSAFLCVLGAGHISFVTGGFVNTWGIFQSYYGDTLFRDTSASAIGWIGSMQYCFYFLPGLVMGRLVDTQQYKPIFYGATTIYPCSLILAAQITQYWQAVLVQGVFFGMCSGIMFSTAVALTGHWFVGRRALAFGIVSASSSIGGAVFPIMIRACIQKLGFPWTMRICGFILAYGSLVGLLTLKTPKRRSTTSGGYMDIKCLESCAYSSCLMGCFFVMLGLYTPLSFFDITGTQLHLERFSSSLISIANSASLFGRLGAGFLGDDLGPVNLLIPAFLGSVASTIAWPFARSLPAITVVAILNGFFQGAFITLYAPAVAQMGPPQDLGRRVGMLSSVIGLGSLFGLPVSGAILSSTMSFQSVSYFAAFSCLAGMVAVMGCSWCVIGGLFGKA